MRTHVVLVPGFGGFDALGRLNYYYGTTPMFAKARSRGAALHYFENLPTASVCTRSLLLERFLCNLVGRNIIEDDDAIVLVGHSTGGLDIRELVARLDKDPTRAHGLVSRIARLVFLSTPHRGTNIADWVREHDIARKVLVNRFRQLVEDDISVPAFLRDIGDALTHGGAQLFEAADDVHRDYHPKSTKDPLELADARDAKYQVRRWLEHTDGDFLAIDDLAVGDAAAQREKLDEERAMWARRGIAARSYATLGRAPFGEVRMEHSLRSVPAVVKAAFTDALDTDLTYRVSYTACCDGPFVAGDLNTAPWLGGKGPFGETGDVVLADSDNDGIVNTASMLLPGGDTVIVPGDHADIIGHFERKPNSGTGTRIYEAYDLLSSGSSFTKQTFEAVWNDVFAFALP
jgi:triacylglycerol lipase